MNIKYSIQMKLAEFLALFKNYNVKNINAFGSAVTDNLNVNSRAIDLNN